MKKIHIVDSCWSCKFIWKHEDSPAWCDHPKFDECEVQIINDIDKIAPFCPLDDAPIEIVKTLDCQYCGKRNRIPLK